MDGQDQRSDAAQIWTQLHPKLAHPVVAVVMGVSGSGKTTIAALLAAAMRWSFQEGDALHPDANVEKMRHGTPLTDEDRRPWLDRVAAVIDSWRANGESGVVACSALRRAYRDRLIGDRPDVALVYLQAPYETIARRMAARHEHFMPLQLLDSQFATLEEPGPDERPIVVDDAATPHDAVVAAIRRLVERDQAA